MVTGIILFHGNFYADFAGFLLYIVVWLAPWFGILMTDYLLRGREYDSLSLRLGAGRAVLAQRRHPLAGRHRPGGRHGRRADVDQRGLRVPSYIGPISNHFPGLAGGDFSWAIGIMVGALLYWALGGRGVRREAAARSPADDRYRGLHRPTAQGGAAPAPRGHLGTRAEVRAGRAERRQPAATPRPGRCAPGTLSAT